MEKTIHLNIISETPNTSDNGTEKENISEGGKQESNVQNNSPQNSGKPSKEEGGRDYEECIACDDLFKGVHIMGQSSEAKKTKNILKSIANIKHLKVSIVQTPYGEITVIEKPIENNKKSSLLTYQEKKRVIKTSSSFFGKILEKVKEKLGLSFGDKAANYFANKAMENAVYNEDDKIEKIKEELGVDAKRAKLFNDVVDTDKRDAYKAISEEVPDNAITKKAKEALTALEQFHDRSAASGLAFEEKQVEERIKNMVRGMSPEKIKEYKETLKEAAVDELSAYEGSVYRNGNGLLVNGRFISTIAKSKGKYNFKTVEGRAKYYFDILWDSGQIQKWASER